MKKDIILRFFSIILILAGFSNTAAAETLASWTFNAESYPSDNSPFNANGGSWQTGSTFTLNGSGSTWNTNKPDYAFTSVTSIVIKCKVGAAVAAETELTLSVDAYYNKANNAPVTSYNLTAAENGGLASNTRLSTNSWSLGTTKTKFTTTYTTASALAAGEEVTFTLTQGGSKGSGQAFINNISVSGTISGGNEGGGNEGGNEGNDDTVVGTFSKLTGGTIGAGTYIFVGDGNKAMLNNTIASNWIYPSTDTYTDPSITNPYKSIVWNVDANGKIQPYGSSQYLYASADKKIALDESNSTNWTFDYSSGSWTISGGNSIGTLQFNSTGWRPYKSSSTGNGAFQIYKLEEGPAELSAPVITSQSETTEYTYTRESSATVINVTATGNPTPSYQWYSNTTNSNSGGTAIAGATSGSFTPTTASVGTTYYYCVATNSVGAATSSVFKVVVNNKTFTVVYDSNGGDGAMTDDNSPYEEGLTVTVLANGFSKIGYTFSGWNTAANGSETAYTEGQTFEISGNVTLYAQWAINTYQVTWMVNGSQWGDTEQVNYNSKPTLPAQPTSADFDESYVFRGWTVDGEYENAASAPADIFTTSSGAPNITKPMTFHAVFAQEQTSNEYTQISNTSDLTTDGKYLIVGNSGSTFKALPVDKAEALVSVSPSSNKIETDDPKIIWTFEGRAGAWKIKNPASGKYIQISGGSLTFENSTNLTFNASASSKSFTFTSSATSGNKVLSYYTSKSIFNAYTSAGTVYVYKAGVDYVNYLTTAKLVPTAYFDLPVHYVYENGAITVPEHVTVAESAGAVIHASGDESAVTVSGTTINAGAAGSSTVMTATIAETDDHTAGSASYLVKVAPTSVSMNSDAIMTAYSSEYHLDFTSIANVRTFVVSAFEDGYASLSELKQVIPSNTGVLVWAEPGKTIEVPVALKATHPEETNYLQAALKDTWLPASDDDFARYEYNQSRMQFEVIEESAPSASSKSRSKALQVTRNSAYLEVPYTETITNKDAIPLTFTSNEGDKIVTGVENVAIDDNYEGDGETYNVWGQRVGDHYRGFVVRNGKVYLRR